VAAFIETFTGGRFRPLSPVWADIRITDIAHALSNQCRFSGHVRSFYSVGEHSVRVAEYVAETEKDTSTILWALLHDASEAYLVDLPTPLKTMEQIGAGYRKAERRVMRAVCQRFGLSKEQPDAVTHADRTLLATEVRDLMFNRPEHWAKVTALPLYGRIRPWAPATAEYEFLRLFEILTGTKGTR
jgi:hypothetical protein